MIAFYGVMFGVAILVAITIVAIRAENKKKLSNPEAGSKDKK
jgi:prolipoprotein diacylglyceryltransferase